MIKFVFYQKNELICFSLMTLFFFLMNSDYSIASTERMSIMNQLENIGEFCDLNTQQDLNTSDVRIRNNENIWHLSMSPNQALRTASLARLAEIYPFVATGPIIRPQFYRPSRTPSPQVIEMQENNNFKNRLAACLLLTLQFSRSCVDGIAQITSIMQLDYKAYAMENLYKKILSDTHKNDTPLILAAQKLIEKIKLKRSDGHIMNDLMESFLQGGLTESEAESLAWDVLGIYGSGGANVYLRVQHFTQNQSTTGGALSMIAASIPVLDGLSKIEGRRYALPQGTVARCDQGKSYHFWLSAYLTRKLIQNGIVAEAAPAAVFAAQKGYQMLSESPGRNPLNIYMQSEFSSYVNSMRIDIAYSAAGIYYGRASTTAHALGPEIDFVIREMFESAGRSPRLSHERAQEFFQKSKLSLYELFSRVLTPDLAYRSFREQFTFRDYRAATH